MQESISCWNLIFGKDSSWLWAMLQFLAVTVTLILIYFQVRLQTSSHVVTTLTTIHTRWNSEDMLRARYSYCYAWVHGNKEFDPVAEYIAEFIEELGNYIRMKAVPTDVMWAAQSWYIEFYYYMFKQGLEEVRSKHKDPTLYQNFECLFASMAKISKRKAAPTFDKREDELDAFARDEIRIAKAFLRLKEDDEFPKTANNGIQPTSCLGG